MADQTPERRIDLAPDAPLHDIAAEELLRQMFDLRDMLFEFEEEDRPAIWRAYDARSSEHLARALGAIPEGDLSASLEAGRKAGEQAGVKRGFDAGFRKGIAAGQKAADERHAANGEATQVIERDDSGAVLSITSELGSGDVEVKRIERNADGRIVRTTTSVAPAP